jgi:hypothetical protein
MVEWQHYEMVFKLRTHERLDTLREFPWRLQKAARSDCTLGGRVADAWILLDQNDPEDHDRVEPDQVDDRLVISVPLTLWQSRLPAKR